MMTIQNQKQLKKQLEPISDYIIRRLCAGASPSAILTEIESEIEMDRELLISFIKGNRESFLQSLSDRGLDMSHPNVRKMAVPEGLRAFLSSKTALPRHLKTDANGLQVEVSTVQGVVTGLSKTSKTYVSGGGNARHWSVHSETRTLNEFFVRDDQGREHPYWHSYENVPLANGQRVTQLYLSTGNATWSTLINHTTGQFWHMCYGRELMYRMGAITKVRWWWMLFLILPCLLIGIALGSQNGSPIIGTGLFVSLILFLIAKTIQAVRGMLAWRKIKPEVEELAKWILVNG